MSTSSCCGTTEIATAGYSTRISAKPSVRKTLYAAHSLAEKLHTLDSSTHLASRKLQEISFLNFLKSTSA